MRERSVGRFIERELFVSTSLLNGPLRSEPTRSVGAGRNDRASGDEHPRARNDSLLDGQLEPDIGIARTLGAEIADGREAGEQRGTQVICRARDTKGERLAGYLVIPRCLIVRMKQHMAMSLDQARQKCRTWERDDFRVGRYRHFASKPGGCDVLATNDDDPAFVQRIAVKDAGRFQNNGCRRGRLCAEARRPSQKKDESLHCRRMNASRTRGKSRAARGWPGQFQPNINFQ